MNIKHIIVLLSLCFTSVSMTGQHTVQKELYEAFVKSDLGMWQKAVEDFEKKANQTSDNDKLLLLHCYYGYASTLIGKKEPEQAKRVIEKAYKLIDKLLEANHTNAEVLNYKGVFGGYESALNKLKAVSLGHQSVRLINEALKLEPNNPQILFDKGNTLYYTPKIFGGNKNEALEYYQRAIKILEKQGKTRYNWIYLQLLFSEAHSLELTDDLQAAKKAYEKILILEPRYKLVKEKYYPNLLNKLK